MRLRDLTETPTDYLDAYCEAEFGHTNWAFRVRADMFMLDPDVEAVVIFYKHSTKEKHE
jgi:hypothetical protein